MQPNTQQPDTQLPDTQLPNTPQPDPLGKSSPSVSVEKEHNQPRGTSDLRDTSDLDSLCAAVAHQTGLPLGRVRKVIVAAQQHLQHSPKHSPRHPQPGSQAPHSATGAQVSTDPLRFYPLGENGRVFPPRAPGG